MTMESIENIIKLAMYVTRKARASWNTDNGDC